MEPEGTSRDDLDVRLQWPGAEPEEAEDGLSAAPEDGMPAETTRAGREDTVAELANMQAVLASISDRLDALTRASASPSGIDGTSADRALMTAMDRLEQSMALQTESSAQSEDRLQVSLGEINDEIRAVASQQADFRQRLNEITHQIETLRRRITLRARSDHPLSPEAVQMIADAVVERLSANGPSSLKGARQPGQDIRRK
ncbi:MAG TPA: hypothetical protein VFZ97_17840 [Acidimicrobiales bacterium]